MSDLDHRCHAPGCERPVPPARFACRKHWYSLPAKVRDALWRFYRPGQEVDKRPSSAYMSVQRFACSRLAFRPYDKGAALRTASLLSEALEYRRQAMNDGGPDPLEDLLSEAQS